MRTHAATGSIVLTTLALTLAFALAGCRSAPASFDEAYTVSVIEADEIDSKYWSRDGELSVQPGDEHAKIAVVGFEVEFVTEKIESPFENQLLAAPATPVTIGATAIGIGRKQIEWGSGGMLEASNIAYDTFLEAATQMGWEVARQEEFVDAPAFQELKKADRLDGSIFRKLTFVASDTGRIKETELSAPYGIEVLDEPWDRIRPAAVEAMDSVSADLWIYMKLRLGVYRGHGTVEEGSVLRFGDSLSETRLTAKRSLVTNVEVLDGDSFQIGRGEVYRVSPDKFTVELRELIRAYLRLAMHRAGDER